MSSKVLLWPTVAPILAWVNMKQRRFSPLLFVLVATFPLVVAASPFEEVLFQVAEAGIVEAAINLLKQSPWLLVIAFFYYLHLNHNLKVSEDVQRTIRQMNNTHDERIGQMTKLHDERIGHTLERFMQTIDKKLSSDDEVQK